MWAELSIVDHEWAEYYINMANGVASKSKDPDHKVGCVIAGPQNQVWSIGFNGFPQKIVDNPLLVPERYEGDLKAKITIHAERNALDLREHSVRGGTLYLNYSPCGICTGCAMSIIQTGIRRVIGPDRLFGEGAGRNGWKDDCKTISVPYMEEAGVGIIEILNFKFR